MSQPRVGILGASGRMGTLVGKLLQTEFRDRAQLLAAPGKGAPLDPLFLVDVVIDFSLPEAMLPLARTAIAHGKSLPAFVIGSTGWKLDDRRVLDELAKKAHVLMSSNFSTGVMALAEILRHAAPVLEKLGYNPVIVETHHRHKKDMPSGTAISLQRAIAPAGPGNVQTHSIRAGEVIGDHEATFYGSADHLTFGHFAQDRAIFARGAIEAALWMVDRRAGSSGFTGLIGMETFFRERYLAPGA